MASALARINSAVCKFTVAISKDSRLVGNIKPYITKDIIKNSVNSNSYILEKVTAPTIYRLMLWVGGDVSYDNDYWIHLPIRTDKDTTIKALVELVEKAESESKEYEYIEEIKIPEIEDIEETDNPTEETNEILINTIPNEIPSLDSIVVSSSDTITITPVEDEKKEEQVTNQITVDNTPHLPTPPYEYAGKRHHRRKK